MSDEFTVGEVCEVEFFDHWSEDRSYRDVGNDTDHLLRVMGRVTALTDRTVVLERSCVLSDEHESNKRIDKFGIIRSCIVKVTRFREEPDDE